MSSDIVSTDICGCTCFPPAQLPNEDLMYLMLITH